MPYHIDIQNALTSNLNISEQDLEKFATLALASQLEHAEITIRLVEATEIQNLNKLYRQKDQATNVLAFPAQIPKDILAEMEMPYLGDVIICPEVLARESSEQYKTLEAHWAHIVIHGILHLLGYDHIEPNDEINMQNIEIQLLNSIGIANPYEEHHVDG